MSLTGCFGVGGNPRWGRGGIKAVVGGTRVGKQEKKDKRGWLCTQAAGQCSVSLFSHQTPFLTIFLRKEGGMSGWQQLEWDPQVLVPVYLWAIAGACVTSEHRAGLTKE